MLKILGQNLLDLGRNFDNSLLSCLERIFYFI